MKLNQRIMIIKTMKTPVLRLILIRMMRSKVYNTEIQPIDVSKYSNIIRYFLDDNNRTLNQLKDEDK